MIEDSSVMVGSKVVMIPPVGDEEGTVVILTLVVHSVEQSVEGGTVVVPGRVPGTPVVIVSLAVIVATWIVLLQSST